MSAAHPRFVLFWEAPMTDTPPPRPEDYKIPSTYRYPRRYAPRDFDEQVAVLRNWWPAIDPDSAWRYRKNLGTTELPHRAEGLFVLVSPHFFRSRETGVRDVLAALREQRRGKFRSYLDGKLDVAHLQQRKRTMEASNRLLIEQGGDLLVVPAQFGARRKGKTTVKHPDPNEFNLDMLSVGCMLLTHPHRFVHDSDLHVNCGGEEVARYAPRSFTHTPYFQFVRGKLRLDSMITDMTFPHDGAATGFLI
jgi:hypothetical protein